MTAGAVSAEYVTCVADRVAAGTIENGDVLKEAAGAGGKTLSCR